MAEERETMPPTPLPTWKELTYEQIDRYFGEIVYGQVRQLAEGSAGDAAKDLFMSNVKAMAAKLEEVRAMVADDV